MAALDFGAARIGLAVADELGKLAHPRPFLPARPREAAMLALVSLAQTEGITLFLVGLPRNLDGTWGPAAKSARDFAKEVHLRTGRRVRLIDERLSTVQASRLLHEAGHSAKRQKTQIDSAAAAVLLQSYLDGVSDS